MAVQIEKIGNAVQFTLNNGVVAVHPLSTLYVHSAEHSDSLDIKYLASRKTVYSFLWSDVDNLSAGDKEEMQVQITTLLN